MVSLGMRLGKLEIFTNGIQRAGQHPKQAPPAAHHSAEHLSFFSALLAFLSTISLLASLFSSASFHTHRAPKPISRPCPPPMRPVHAQPYVLHFWITLTCSFPHLFYTGRFLQINIWNNQVHSSLHEIWNIFTEGLKTRNTGIPL